VERYVIRGGKRGYERLQLLARARMPDTRDLFDRVGITPGWRCLDLGCGSGDVTFEIARRIGPDGHVTGIDMDATKLELARSAAAGLGLTQVEFRSSDVSAWHERDAYDMVYSRFLLQHLQDPVDLLRRMWAALRPGGALVVEDADFDGLFCHPPNDAFDFYADNYRRVLALNGGDPAIGRKLYGYFGAAGISRPELNLVQSVYAAGEGKTLAFSTLEATADSLLEARLATPDVISAALASLARFTEDPDTIVGDPRIFQLWCRR
jgi:ubiquinone/menaquinone biosynthesis C-methylase UbiE